MDDTASAASRYWISVVGPDRIIRAAIISNVPQEGMQEADAEAYALVMTLGVGSCRLNASDAIVAYERPPAPEAPAVTFKADIWRRCSDEQAEILAEALSNRSVREQRLFSDAQQLVHTDEDFLNLQAAVVALLGRVEADRILAPSI